MCKTLSLRALGESAEKNKELYGHDKPDFNLLERFQPPPSETIDDMWIRARSDEFTCLCPITGQPDFASIVIDYMPNTYCVESKSLKIYLGSYRHEGGFHEAITKQICNDLTNLLAPQWLMVFGAFAARGGIPFHPRVKFGPVPSSLFYREKP
jgi:7-cyano-7-deazaguanine reductase